MLPGRNTFWDIEQSMSIALKLQTLQKALAPLPYIVTRAFPTKSGDRLSISAPGYAVMPTSTIMIATSYPNTDVLWPKSWILTNAIRSHDHGIHKECHKMLQL